MDRLLSPAAVALFFCVHGQLLAEDSQNQNWGTKTVVAKTKTASVFELNSQGKLVSWTRSHAPAMVVLIDHGSTLEVETRGMKAWLNKSEYLPLAEANAFFTKCIDANPHDSWSLSQRGLTWLELHNSESALLDLSEAIRLSPDGSRNYFLRALVWGNKREFDKAILDCTQVVRLDGTEPNALCARADFWLAKKEYDTAVSDYTEALALDSTDALTVLKRGRAWKAKGKFEQAIADCSECLRLLPGMSPGLQSRGQCFACQGNHSAAIADFTSAIGTQPQDPSLYLDRGRSRAAQGNANLGVADYCQAINLAPQLAEAWFQRAIVRIATGEIDLALSDLSCAIEIERRDMRFFHNRGLVWAKKGQYDNAIRDYSEAIRLDPLYAPALRNRGLAWVEKHELDKARNDYSEASKALCTIASAPGYHVDEPSRIEKFNAAMRDFENILHQPEVQENLLTEQALLLASHTNAGLRDGKLALAFAQKALNQAGTSAGWKHYSALAAAHAESGEYDRAVAAQVKAIKDQSLDDKTKEELKKTLNLFEQNQPLRISTPLTYR